MGINHYIRDSLKGFEIICAMNSPNVILQLTPRIGVVPVMPVMRNTSDSEENRGKVGATIPFAA